MATKSKFEPGIFMQDGDEWKPLAGLLPDCPFDMRFREAACGTWTGSSGGVVRGDFLVSKVEGGWRFTRPCDGWEFRLFEADTPPGEAELWDFLAESGEAVDVTLEWNRGIMEGQLEHLAGLDCPVGGSTAAELALSELEDADG